MHSTTELSQEDPGEAGSIHLCCLRGLRGCHRHGTQKNNTRASSGGQTTSKFLNLLAAISQENKISIGVSVAELPSFNSAPEASHRAITRIPVRYSVLLKDLPSQGVIVSRWCGHLREQSFPCPAGICETPPDCH